MLYRTISLNYRGDKHVLKTERFRLKTTSRLTEYFDSMYDESHIWINAGIEARRAGLTVIDTNKIATICQTIPQAWVHGAIKEGHKMEGCSHIKYGKKVYPLYSVVPLRKKSKGDVVYFPKCNTPFKLQKGNIPDTSQSYKIVDVTNHADKERQFELHVTIREHVPDRVATGTHAGADMGGKHTLIVGKSDGSVAMLTLREKDTLRNIARIQKKMSRCKRGSHKWCRLHAQLQSVYKKMGNRQEYKLRKFSKKLLEQCDKLIMEGMNLATMTTKGSEQKNKNRMMRQSKCGEARAWLAQQALKHNTEYIEGDPKHTSQQCCMCGSMDTWRKSSQFRCYNCGVLMHADVNAAFNILFIFDAVWWSKRAQSVYHLQNKAGMVLRGKIHLGACTTPPSASDVMAGTGCPKDGCQNPTNKEHLNEAPLNGVWPTSLERVVMST